jgi:hypothetical protein
VEVPRTPRVPRKHYAVDDDDYEPDPDECMRAAPRTPKKRRTSSAGSPWARSDGCGAAGAWGRGLRGRAARKRHAHALTVVGHSAAQGGQAPLALPQVSVSDITAVDWHSLRAAGFVGCVFDKVRPTRPVASRPLQLTRAAPQDNTLTAPYAREVHPPLRAALAECLEAFSGRAVLLRRGSRTRCSAFANSSDDPARSNSAGLTQYDPTGAEADALSETLGIPVLRHSTSP